MKKIVGTLLMLVLIAGIFSGCSDNYNGDFRNVSWGMTLDEVKSVETAHTVDIDTLVQGLDNGTLPQKFSIFIPLSLILKDGIDDTVSDTYEAKDVLPCLKGINAYFQYSAVGNDAKVGTITIMMCEGIGSWKNDSDKSKIFDDIKDYFAKMYGEPTQDNDVFVWDNSDITVRTGMENDNIFIALMAK